MYFWITGDNEELITNTLSYLHATNIRFIKKNIVTFSTSYPERLQTTASLIKWWIILSKEILETHINTEIIGIADKVIWTQLKKTIEQIKRFKIVELIHTDLEIKNFGQEIISIDNDQYGIVSGYQNIKLYETVDFDKPVSGMGIGMMPSKLALSLINIGIGKYESFWKSINSNITIWDPFCGFGTTNFLVNHLWYNTIWSDINPIQIKQNRKRRCTLWIWDTNRLSTFIKHDVTQPFTHPIFYKANIIVSEGRLWHIVTNRTAQNEVEQYSNDVEIVYKTFFENLTHYYRSSKQHLNNPTTIVITIPTWLKHEISISKSIKNHINSLWRTTILLEKPYSREKQLVGRKILIATYWKD